jgi:hypothetical protein
MMKNVPSLVVTVAVLLAIPSGASCAGFCRSEAFRAAFLDGQGVMEDFISASPRLTALGDQAVPCLQTIAEHGEETLGIECQLQEVEGGCRTWSVVALQSIGTPRAQEALAGLLRVDQDPIIAARAIRQLWGLKAVERRPEIFTMLQHPDPAVQAEAVSALAAFGDRTDLEAMLDVAVSLPDQHFYTTVMAFAKLEDRRVVEPLARRATTVEDPTIKKVVDKMIADLRSKSTP